VYGLRECEGDGGRGKTVGFDQHKYLHLTMDAGAFLRVEIITALILGFFPISGRVEVRNILNKKELR